MSNVAFQVVSELEPADRVAAVRPFWTTLSQEERVKFLTVSVDDLKARARLVMKKMESEPKIGKSVCGEICFFMSSSAGKRQFRGGSGQERAWLFADFCIIAFLQKRSPRRSIYFWLVRTCPWRLFWMRGFADFLMGTLGKFGSGLERERSSIMLLPSGKQQMSLPCCITGPLSLRDRLKQ